MSRENHGCYRVDRAPQVFLSFETPRERRALPYALLVDLEIATDSTLLKIVFSHYEVFVRGSQMDAVYESVRSASCAAIFPGTPGADDSRKDVASVVEIRIKRLNSPD